MTGKQVIAKALPLLLDGVMLETEIGEILHPAIFFAGTCRGKFYCMQIDRFNGVWHYPHPDSDPETRFELPLIGQVIIFLDDYTDIDLVQVRTLLDQKSPDTFVTLFRKVEQLPKTSEDCSSQDVKLAGRIGYNKPKKEETVDLAELVEKAKEKRVVVDVSGMAKGAVPRRVLGISHHRQFQHEDLSIISSDYDSYLHALRILVSDPDKRVEIAAEAELFFNPPLGG
jgi:hypothetical protein